MKEKGDQVSDLLYPKLTELRYYYSMMLNSGKSDKNLAQITFAP